MAELKTTQKTAMEVRKKLSELFLGSQNTVVIFLAGIFSKSKILLWSAHGKGKSFLAETTAKLCGVSYSRIQGTQGLTESKFLARYDLSKLLKGEEKVQWRDFVRARIKLLDEINRCHPTVLNALFSMLAEKMVLYGDERVNLSDFAFIGTLNPSDEGTYDVPPPLIDRFDISIAISSPAVYEKSQMLDLENKIISPMLDETVLLQIWSEVDKITVSDQLINTAAAFIRELQICEHGDKEFLTNFPQCCAECRFNENICSKLEPAMPVSERAFLSLLKISKAVAYVLGSAAVDDKHLKFALPYILMHRLKFTPAFEKESKNKIHLLRSVVNKIIERDIERTRGFDLIKRFESGDFDEYKNIKEYAVNDLVIAEVYRNLQKKYGEVVKIYEENIAHADFSNLLKIKHELKTKKSLSWQDGVILKLINAEMSKKLQFTSYISESTWVKFVEYLEKEFGVVNKNFTKEQCDGLDILGKIRLSWSAQPDVKQYGHPTMYKVTMAATSEKHIDFLHEVETFVMFNEKSAGIGDGLPF